MTSSDLWDAETARRYDAGSAAMFAPEVLDPTVDFLAGLAGGGPVLELAIGTGRVGVALARRGVPVCGIELSAPMLERLRTKLGERELPCTLGDMANATAPPAPGHALAEGGFAVVALVFNTLGNLCTQEEQVRCFANAARHLVPGGCFVIELGVPALRRLPPGQGAVPFHVGAHHVGFDTYDPVTQRGTSHHYHREDDSGPARYGRTNFRYVWPAECDLMARLAGMEPVARYADWDRSAFTADSTSHVSVWRRPETLEPTSLT